MPGRRAAPRRVVATARAQPLAARGFAPRKFAAMCASAVDLPYHRVRGVGAGGLRRLRTNVPNKTLVRRTHGTAASASACGMTHPRPPHSSRASLCLPTSATAARPQALRHGHLLLELVIIVTAVVARGNAAIPVQWHNIVVLVPATGPYTNQHGVCRDVQHRGRCESRLHVDGRARTTPLRTVPPPPDTHS